MLELNVTLKEEFDDKTSSFVVAESVTLKFEHSLASMSKWESTFEKPFLGNGEKTSEETLFYIKNCMFLEGRFPEEIFQKMTKQNFDEIQAYIAAKRSATWFNDPPNRPVPKQILTSEVIYGMMVAYRIPFETQYWHLNNLITLIRVCSEQSKQPKKMGRAEAARQQAALVAKRRAEMGTRG